MKRVVTLFGLTVLIVLSIFFYKDPDLKIKEVMDLAKQSTGFGADYSAFTAQSIFDYVTVFKRGLAYRLGIDRENYPSLNLSLDMTAISSLNRQRKGEQSKRSWVQGEMISNEEGKEKNIFKIKLKPKGIVQSIITILMRCHLKLILEVKKDYLV